MQVHYPRRQSTPVQVGDLVIGGGAPIVVQTMNNRPAHNVVANISQLHKLRKAGCQMSRLAVPDRRAAEAFATIKKSSPIPLVADIHFQAELAVRAIEAGCDKLRLNPGNIRDRAKLREVIQLAQRRKVPIRVGVNSGSLDREILERFGGPTAEALMTQGLEALKLCEEAGHEALVLSLKTSDPMTLIEANREAALRTHWPLHLGLTESGTEQGGILRSAAAIGTLLAEGIGDTIRISLQAEPEREIKACYGLLRALGLSHRGAELIVCPGCGRTEVDLRYLAERVEAELSEMTEPIKVALMGCVVNGPGEAREADIGLAGGRKSYALFKRGEVVDKVSEAEALPRLLREIAEWREEYRARELS